MIVSFGCLIMVFLTCTIQLLLIFLFIIFKLLSLCNGFFEAFIITTALDSFSFIVGPIFASNNKVSSLV